VIEDRLAVLQKLKKKYGGSIETVLATQDRLRQELERIQNSDAELKRHDDLIHQHQRTMSRLAQQLTRKRSEAAGRMTKAVRQELNALKMNQTQFRITVTSDNGEGSWGSNGSDRAEFLFSANVGEPHQPLSRVASGGELSRVMLALKSVLAKADQVPVLIFDEIDMGVGGAVAAAIGKRLRAIGRFHQVFCITHLPQVASQAQHHLCVEKSQSKNRTLTSVRTLSGLQRETEIARMLGGETVTKKVRDTAAELIAGASD